MYLTYITFKRILFITIIAIFVLPSILLYHNVNVDKRLRDNFTGVINSHSNVEQIKLDKFPIYEQLYAWSCGPTTISMVYTYLNNPKSEKQILNENKLLNRNSGMFPKTFESYLRKILKEYNVELRSNIKDSEVISIIYNQLKKGIPVPIYFSTINKWDKPNYDTHYSAIMGIDSKGKTVTIANAYGFEEQVSLKDFLASLKYDNYKDKPFAFQLATFFGVIKKNNIYILSKK